jgi:hypothetical protein
MQLAHGCTTYTVYICGMCACKAVHSLCVHMDACVGSWMPGWTFSVPLGHV